MSLDEAARLKDCQTAAVSESLASDDGDLCSHNFQSPKKHGVGGGGGCNLGSVLVTSNK